MKIRIQKQFELFAFPKKKKVRIVRERPAVALVALEKIFRYGNMMEDILLALRYCYYVAHKSVVSDSAYDAMELKYMESGKCPKDSPLARPGSDRQEDYLPHIRALSLYLLFAAYNQSVGSEEHKKAVLRQR